MVQKRSAADRAFDCVNIFIMLLVVAVTVYPFYYVLVGSVSSVGHLMSGKFIWYPDTLDFGSYKRILWNSRTLNAYGNTLFIVLAGTAISMVLTTLGAYVLSKRYLPGRTAMTLFVVFTMLFNGGLIPTYLTVRAVGLLDSIWALIWPVAISAYNMVVMRNFLFSIPISLEESAQLDGASHMVILWKIFIPLMAPVLATITLFYAVSYWNAFFNATIYINSQEKWPVQMILREVLIQSRSDLMVVEDEAKLAAENMKMALVVVTVLPIIMIYPFLQKYFVKGVLIGSVKG